MQRHLGLHQLKLGAPARARIGRVLLVLIASALPHAAAAQANPGLIVFDGDSVSAGATVPTTMGPANQLSRLTRTPSRVKVVAVSARPVYTTVALYNATVAPLFDQEAAFNIIAYHAGDNDIAQKKSVDDTYKQLSHYISLAHAQGWKVIVSTELARLHFSKADERKLEAYNKMIISNKAGADAVIDFANMPGMDLKERAASAYFSSDLVHPNANGYAVLAHLLAGAVDELEPISASPRQEQKTDHVITHAIK